MLPAPLLALREGSADSQVRTGQNQFCVARGTLVPRLASPFPLSDRVTGQLLSLAESSFSHLWTGTVLALQYRTGDNGGKAPGTGPASGSHLRNGS